MFLFLFATIGHMNKQNLNMEFTEMTEENGDEITNLPQTYIVMQLDPETPATALKWLVDKIRGRRRDGGAELVLFKQPTQENEVNIQQLEVGSTLEYNRRDPYCIVENET